MTTTDPISSNSVLNSYLTQQAQQQAAASAANSTSSTGVSSSSTLAGLSGNFNTFLSILTTQLQYQDPTAATDTNQFTQELVEFSGVEQQLNTNSDLQTLINLQKSNTGLSQTLGYIGKYVEVPSTSQMPLQSGQGEIAYTLPAGVSNVTINVLDSSGKTVATLTGPTATGLDRVAWDGRDSSGDQLADGTYTFQLNATDASGAAVNVTDIRTLGVVTGVTTNSDGTSNLSLGAGMSVSSSSVDAVYDSGSPPTAVSGDVSASAAVALTNSSANLSYVLANSANTVSVTILDSSGKLVNQLSGGSSAGTNTITWDGTDSNGNQLADGTYIFEVSARDANGNLMSVTNLSSAPASSS